MTTRHGPPESRSAPEYRDRWLDAPDLPRAREALSASNAPWIAGVGSAAYLVYLGLDLLNDRFALGALDLLALAFLGTTFWWAVQGRLPARTLNRLIAIDLLVVVLAFGAAVLVDPSLFGGPGFTVLLIGFGFLFLSWRAFALMGVLTVGIWALAGWAVGELTTSSVLGAIVPGIGLGAIILGTRRRTFDRLYKEHAARVSHEVALRRQERLSSLGTLVAGVAHEINNPLTYINGNIELSRMELEDALSRAGLEDDQRNQLREVVRMHDQALGGLRQIERIVQGLRVVARGGSAGPLQPTCVNEILHQVLAVARTRLLASIVIETKLDEPCYVAADPGRLSQVFLNLILNAGQAMEDRPEGRLAVEARHESGKVVVEVRDNGPGIDPEIEARLFTPFATTKTSGTGLGLSVSRSIAMDHGGDITYRTQRGKGTSFYLELPSLPRPPARSSARPARHPEATSPAAKFESRVTELI